MLSQAGAVPAPATKPWRGPAGPGLTMIPQHSTLLVVAWRSTKFAGATSIVAAAGENGRHGPDDSAGDQQERKQAEAQGKGENAEPCHQQQSKSDHDQRQRPAHDDHPTGHPVRQA